MTTSVPNRRSARKDLGAFYSPRSLVEPLVKWAIQSRHDTVLDPSCGDGIFLEAGARRLVFLGARPAEAANGLIGIDMNPKAIAVAAAVLASTLRRPPGRLHTMDFFKADLTVSEISAAGGVNAVVGNPPYIRYQDFTGAIRLQALRRAAIAGVELSQLTSSWAPFVVHSATFLKRGGRLALILPAELIHASYAGAVRQWLRRRFGSVTIVSFRRTVFPGVQEKVVLLLAARFGDPCPGTLGLMEVDDTTDLHSMDDVMARSQIFAPGSEPGKWLPGHAAGPAVGHLTRLEQDSQFVPLGRLAKANIGFVTGANSFFVLSPRRAKELKLPKKSLHHCVVRARQIPGAFLSGPDYEALFESDEQCLLWRPRGPLSLEEVAYVRRGVRLGVSQRFKCRMRDPWYVVPGVIRPDALFTYMSDSVPRLCLNEAGLVATNNLLTIKMHGVPSELRRAMIVGFYNSATLFSLEWIGRSYGGGVLKLEPREADRVLVPSIAIIRTHAGRLEKLAGQLHSELCAGRRGAMRPVIEQIDELILRPRHAEPCDGVIALSAAREQLMGARRISANG